jgi:prepilin-type processing-associated H-X9-DG protein
MIVTALVATSAVLSFLGRIIIVRIGSRRVTIATSTLILVFGSSDGRARLFRRQRLGVRIPHGGGTNVVLLDGVQAVAE